MKKYSQIEEGGWTDEAIQYTKYRWEFLRRNPEFIKDWEEMAEDQKENSGPHHDMIVTKDKREGRNGLRRSEFVQKWKCNPFSPHHSYDHYIETSNDPVIAHKKMFVEIHQGFALRMPIITDDYCWDDVIEDGPEGQKLHNLKVSQRVLERHKIKVLIDLRYSKRRLLNELERCIDAWKLRIEQEEERKGIARRHFDNFDTYLKVYDLKTEGTSWSQIAKNLKLNSIQTARNHYKTAHELIKKGIDLYAK